MPVAVGLANLSARVVCFLLCIWRSVWHPPDMSGGGAGLWAHHYPPLGQYRYGVECKLTMQNRWRAGTEFGWA